jgi:peptidoglycan/xylan/chitin deacetylase (PgdA/CDA1 family)
MPRMTGSLLPGGKRKALTLSYDDGTLHDRRLVEILNRYGVRGTFHLNSGALGRETHLRKDEIATLFAGHEVAGHSATHPFLTDVPDDIIAGQIVEDRLKLEALVGHPVKGFSYPYGAFDDRVVQSLRQLGIVYARTTASHGRFTLPSDPLRWAPTCHHKNKLLETAAEFKAAKPGRPALLYVWGRSLSCSLAPYCNFLSLGAMTALQYGASGLLRKKPWW